MKVLRSVELSVSETDTIHVDRCCVRSAVIIVCMLSLLLSPLFSVSSPLTHEKGHVFEHNVPAHCSEELTRHDHGHEHTNEGSDCCIVLAITTHTHITQALFGASVVSAPADVVRQRFDPPPKRPPQLSRLLPT